MLPENTAYAWFQALLVVSAIFLIPLFIAWLAGELSDAPSNGESEDLGEEDHPLPYKEPKKAHGKPNFSDHLDN